MEEVRAAGDDPDTRSCDKLVERLRVSRRDQAILLAPDNVGRNGNAMEPAVELGIAQARRPGELRCRSAVTVVDVLELRRGAPLFEPLGPIAREQQLQQIVLGG